MPGEGPAQAAATEPAEPTEQLGETASGESQPSGGGHADAEDYLARVRQSIQGALVFPAAARRLGLNGQVVLHFAIASDGHVPEDSLAVIGGSLSELLRDGAIRSVRHAAPFPPLPNGSLSVELPVAFNRGWRSFRMALRPVPNAGAGTKGHASSG